MCRVHTDHIVGSWNMYLTHLKSLISPFSSLPPIPSITWFPSPWENHLHHCPKTQLSITSCGLARKPWVLISPLRAVITPGSRCHRLTLISQESLRSREPSQGHTTQGQFSSKEPEPNQDFL